MLTVTALPRTGYTAGPATDQQRCIATRMAKKERRDLPAWRRVGGGPPFAAAALLNIPTAARGSSSAGCRVALPMLSAGHSFTLRAKCMPTPRRVAPARRRGYNTKNVANH
jgi:hypothetical protein